MGWEGKKGKGVWVDPAERRRPHRARLASLGLARIVVVVLWLGERGGGGGFRGDMYSGDGLCLRKMMEPVSGMDCSFPVQRCGTVRVHARLC